MYRLILLEKSIYKLDAHFKYTFRKYPISFFSVKNPVSECLSNWNTKMKLNIV